MGSRITADTAMTRRIISKRQHITVSVHLLTATSVSYPSDTRNPASPTPPSP